MLSVPTDNPSARMDRLAVSWLLVNMAAVLFQRLSAAVMESTVVQKTLSVMCPQENASEETNYQWIGLLSCQLGDPKMWFVLMASQNARPVRHVVNWPLETMDAALYQKQFAVVT